MKRCPLCRAEYFDMTLEFCLEDGRRLVASDAEEVPTAIRLPVNIPPTMQETVELKSPLPTEPPQFAVPDTIQQPAPTERIKEAVAEKSIKFLEIAPLVIALAHNWWQWIYLDNQYYSSFSAYVLSANFLMWLLLLAAGTVTGLLALKRCRNKGFVFAALVILSINLILFLVPKR